MKTVRMPFSVLCRIDILYNSRLLIIYHHPAPLRPWRRAGTSQNLPDDDLSFFADPGFPDQETKPCSLNDDRGSPEIGFGGKGFMDGRQGSSSVDMPTPITWDPTAISTPQHYVTPPNQRGQRRTSDILMRDADSSPLANQMSPQLDLKVPGGHEYHSIRKYGPLTRPPLSSSKRLYSNLCDVLESTTVPPPQFYKPNNPLHPNVVSTAGIVGEPHVLSGMKSLTAAIVKVPVDQQIRYLVSAPELLKFLLVEARNKAMVRVLWDNPDHIIAISGVHPYYTGAELPEIAHCERDMEVWIRKLLLQSSLRAWSIIDYGITNPLIFSRKPTGPFWTAGVQAKSPTLADSVLVHEHQSLSLRSIPVILEAKCDNVLRAQSNRSTEPSDMDIEPSPDAEVWKTVFEPITCEGSANSGKAMFFRWPVSPASASNSTLTRIIVQVRK